MGIIYREDIMGMSEVDSGPFAVFAVSSVHSAAGVDHNQQHHQCHCNAALSARGSYSSNIKRSRNCLKNSWISRSSRSSSYCAPAWSSPKGHLILLAEGATMFA